MCSVPSAIASLSLEDVADSILSELDQPEQLLHAHYAQYPPTQLPPHECAEWMGREDERTKNYIYLAAHMVQNKVRELGHCVSANPFLKEKSPAAMSSASNDSLKSMASMSALTAKPSFSSLSIHRVPSSGNLSSVGSLQSLRGEGSMLNSYSSKNNNSLSSLSSASSGFLGAPSSSCQCCGMNNDLCSFAATNLPLQVYYNLFYTCVVGMDMSTETLLQGIILFGRLMKDQEFRASLLPLELIARSRVVQAATPIAKRHSFMNPAEDKYGARKLWQQLDSCISTSVVNKTTATNVARKCNCFEQTSHAYLRDMLWSLNEAVMAALLACFCIAVKTSEDTQWANQCWSKVSGFALREFNNVEKRALDVLSYATFVSWKEYSSFVKTYCTPFSSRPIAQLGLVPTNSNLVFTIKTSSAPANPKLRRSSSFKLLDVPSPRLPKWW